MALPDKISIGHGSGGSMMRDLIEEIFLKEFDPSDNRLMADSAILDIAEGSLAFTCDSYVVDPIFFPGGDIGKLSVCGTVNDLAVSGAIPQYLSAGFIIEEGFDINTLGRIVKSMAREAQSAGVKIVTGDTKIVGKGLCDKVFINTAGVGWLPEKNKDLISAKNVKEGNKLIINGSIGDHAMTILKARSEIPFDSKLESDCSSLNTMLKSVLNNVSGVNFIRDATRGGLATVLVELATMRNISMTLNEPDIPVKDPVAGLCEILGFDPLYLANEGKVVIVAESNNAEEIVRIMQEYKEGKDAAIIGEIGNNSISKVYLNTIIGGKRIVDMLASDQLPRIC